MTRRVIAAAVLAFGAARAPAALAQTSRVAILQAEDRRAPTPRDLAIIRGGLHSGDPETTRIAVRALGRLERPALVADILPSLRNPLPEIRAEAANAIGQALQGLARERVRVPAVRQTKSAPAAAASTLDAAVSALQTRLAVEAEPAVRETICETLGRLPYSTADEVDRAEQKILDDARNSSVADRLGIAQGLYALARLDHARPPSDAARTMLADLARVRTGEEATGARVRRVAMEALLLGTPDPSIVRAAAWDPDMQVRRLAVRAAASPTFSDRSSLLSHGLADDAAMVRLEAVRGYAAQPGAADCSTLVGALKDRATVVDLAALDGLAACGASDEAIDALARTATDLSEAESPRGWHRPAHAIVALAAASPDKAAAALAPFTGARIWQMRLYGARAATALKDRATLDKLAADPVDNVVEAALEGLSKTAGHDADALYVSGLSRSGYQAIRAAARALRGSPNATAAVPALQDAFARLAAEGHDNSHDARDAIVEALASLGAPAPAHKPRPAAPPADLSAVDLRHLGASRARVTIRGVGTFELALVPAEAPATVLRFAELAQSGYYNGLSFHRVVPNFVIQGGSPGANEYVGDASFMRDELGMWPHVRGAVGISTRGRDTGDAQFFIDLVDNPRLDHDYTVFAQVLNGMDVVDQILEGDVIERIDILPGQ